MNHQLHSNGRRPRAYTAIALGVVLSASCVTAICAPTQQGLTSYQLPSAAVVDILDTESPPDVAPSPDGKWLLIRRRKNAAGIAELAAPNIQLAGHRIDPRTNALHGSLPGWGSGYTLVRVADLAAWPLEVPDHRVSRPLWAPDSRRFAFLHGKSNGVELWAVDIATRRARVLGKPAINLARGMAADPCVWMPDSTHVLCQTVPEHRGEPPRQALVPSGPVVQNRADYKIRMRAASLGLLQSPHDEALYDYHMTSQLSSFDVRDGVAKLIGAPSVYESVAPSPDGRYLLLVSVARPYSYAVTDDRFAKTVDVLDLQYDRPRTIAKLGVNGAGSQLTGWVHPGARRFTWIPGSSASLAYIEALDAGDPNSAADHRDRLVRLDAPFTGEPVELLRTRGRMASLYSTWTSGAFGNIAWTSNGMALVEEGDLLRRHKRAWLVDALRPRAEPLLIWEHNADDHYSYLGDPLFTLDDRGQDVLLYDGGWIYFAGRGASPRGDRPVLHRLHAETRRVERLFTSSDRAVEFVQSVLSTKPLRILVQHESPLQPPRHYVVDVERRTRRPVTQAVPVSEALSRIQTRLINYSRGDGVSLSGTLLLPAGYVSGRPLPVVIWGYPLDRLDRTGAQQVLGSPSYFPWGYRQTGTKVLVNLLATQGYAVLEAGMPVVGGTLANDTAVAQIKANAQAAVDELIELGIADPQRIGIAGHSYGGLMTAILLAETDLFAAGVALSGLYNLTLTPLGFQYESRNLWDARQVYIDLSAVMHADRIESPLLFVHGELDRSEAAFPEQSIRMHRALSGLGKTSRLVLLPHEGHVYSARESVLHVAWEISSWFNRYLRADPIPEADASDGKDLARAPSMPAN